MKEYSNFFGKVVVVTAKEYNNFIRGTVDPVRAFRESDPDVLYEISKGKNPLLFKDGYVVMAFPRVMRRTPEGYPSGEYHHEKDAKDEKDAIMKTKERILSEIANNIPIDPFILKLFEGIDIRVGLFF